MGETIRAVFALSSRDVQVFSQVRFQWTRFSGSHPGDLFGTPICRCSSSRGPWDDRGPLARLDGMFPQRGTRHPPQGNGLFRLNPGG